MLALKYMSMAQEPTKPEQTKNVKFLGPTCVPGEKMPLYSFAKRSSFDAGLVGPRQSSLLDDLINAKWTAAERLFRYDVSACRTKVIPGENGFVAQLNEGRNSKKRPTEFRIDQVLQNFDQDKFNFTKIPYEELLFRFEESVDGTTRFQEGARIENESPLNVVIINVSPIELNHVLLVPRVMDHLQQKIQSDTFLLALKFAAEFKNESFRVGYNSLGAFATVNHLHFQAYSLEHSFALEKALTVPVRYPREEGGVLVSETLNYPVRTLVFEHGRTLKELAGKVAKVCIILQEKNIPFNVLISDAGRRVFVMPQCFAERQAHGQVEQAILDLRVNPAVFEISGHMILFREEDYEFATEEYAWRLLREVSLTEDRFNEVKRLCMIVPDEMAVTPIDDPQPHTSEEESVKFGYRSIEKMKAKVRKSFDLIPRQECILPRA